MSVTVLDKYKDVRYNLFKWRCEASLIHKIILAFAMACFTGIAAQVRIPLPWTPVPISAQTFAVLLSGVLLGGWYGGLSQVFYIGAGVAGVPYPADDLAGLLELAVAGRQLIRAICYVIQTPEIDQTNFLDMLQKAIREDDHHIVDTSVFDQLG